MEKPVISRKAFWDVRFEELDYDRYSLFVMEKVFNYGPWADQLAIMRYYGLPRIKNEIVKANYLRKPVLSFLSTVLEIEKNEFECYRKKQSDPLPWPY